MINQFNERITYNEQTEKVSWTTLADTYTLPSQYQEVEYIENCKGCKHGTKATGGRIVLDGFKMSDVPLNGTLNIDFNMSNINSPSTFQGNVWFGGGRFTAPTDGQSYDISVWSYQTDRDVDGSKIDIKKAFYVTCAPYHFDYSDGCYTSVMEYTPYYVYNFNIHYTYASASNVSWGGTIREYNTWMTPYYRIPDSMISNDGKFNYDTHLCIFDIVMRDFTYPQYYAWAYNSRATSTGHAITSSYDFIGKRFYSRGKITINDNMYMYLYACYNKETHQYGLYDAVNKKFYGDFIETLDNVWVNNPNYYWERINTASGSTVQAREKTFLNICGPDIKTT